MHGKKRQGEGKVEKGEGEGEGNFHAAITIESSKNLLKSQCHFHLRIRINL